MYNRFIRYTAFDTQSDENSQTVPSTSKQLLFANYLKEEMIAEGLVDVYLDEQGYLYGMLPANTDDADNFVIGFISHYDTSPDCSGKNVKARIIRNYDGKDITLSPGIISSVEKFPELRQHIGEDIIVTDGKTLLGADDKAGIAEIMQAMCYMRDHPEIKHGKIRVAFNPDEEIGMGAHHFNVEHFACDWAYTVDGGDEGELEYENFNAASAKVYVTGVSVHPGYAKGKMLNAARIATEFAAMLPADETPETTEGYEGFFHLTNITGGCERAQLNYIIRDHDCKRFKDRKLLIQSIARKINEKYAQEVCRVVVADQYYNMKEVVAEAPINHVTGKDIITTAKDAMIAAGVKPKIQPIRGGTDGAQLSFKGLPCPNLFTGAVNFHGPHEFVSIQVMEKAVQTIINIIHNS